MKFPHVAVLMSTFNGQTYLDDQISSILNQSGVCVSLLVRDDGSTDETTNILDYYKNKRLLSWYVVDNLKPARSFLHLLSHAKDAEYFAFSDQDDFWMPEKLKVATDMLSPFQDEPALYFCQTQLADSHLNMIETGRIHPLLTFGESLVYQFVSGCTIVMNAKLREILNKYSPVFLPMHDVWIYVVAVGMGAKIVFDPESHILYRQHGGNVVGQGFDKKTIWKRRFNRIVKNKEHIRFRLAQELKMGYSDIITEANRQILDKFLSGQDSFLKRLSIMGDSRYKCANRSVYRNFLISVLLNTY